MHNSEYYASRRFQYKSIWFNFYSNGTQTRHKWILISLNISVVIYIYNLSLNHISVLFTTAKNSLFHVINSSQQKTRLRRGCETFRGYVARTLRQMWTRDPTCNIQIPAVCSLWHRITEHQTWLTHRYWFWLSPLWQQQDSPCRILSLVSTYFIIVYLLRAFSTVVFGSYISGEFKGYSCWRKGHWIGGLSEFLLFWLVTRHSTTYIKKKWRTNSTWRLLAYSKFMTPDCVCCT